MTKPFGLLKDLIPVLMPLGLIFLSMGLMLWQHYGMVSQYSVYPNERHSTFVVTDESNGGSSRATLHQEGEALVMDCQIQMQYQWPYCEVQFQLGVTYASGLNGQDFDRLLIRLTLDAPTENEKIRVFLMDHTPSFTQEEQYNTLMPTQIEYSPGRYQGVLSVPLDTFSTASWWLSQADLPLHQQKATYQSIPYVQISTGSIVNEGRYRMVIEEIAFEGKWVSKDQLYMLLIAIWVLYAFTWVVNRSFILRTNLQDAHRRSEELAALNKTLEISQNQLKEQAQRDALTGLRNRYGLRDPLYHHVRTAQQEHRPLSLMFIDIDHFKRINDQHGHALGDEILREFSSLIRGHIRDQDILARWGGEEFLLLCPDTPLKNARQLAEKLRACINQFTWPNGLSVSASFGVAELGYGSSSNLIRMADEAMYRAKHSGRNRVVTAPEDQKEAG